MPRIEHWTLLGAMVTLAGCAAQSRQPYAPAYTAQARLSPDARANQVAFAYNADFMQGGMAGVMHDIERCYRTTTGQIGTGPDVIALRECMALDYTAYNIDQLDGRRANGAPLPFFTDEAMKARLARYGPLARFDTAAHMIAYLKDMHQLVQRHLIHDWKERTGHCARNVTDPDCS